MKWLEEKVEWVIGFMAELLQDIWWVIEDSAKLIYEAYKENGAWHYLKRFLVGLVAFVVCGAVIVSVSVGLILLMVWLFGVNIVAIIATILLGILAVVVIYILGSLILD